MLLEIQKVGSKLEIEKHLPYSLEHKTCVTIQEIRGDLHNRANIKGEKSLCSQKEQVP